MAIQKALETLCYVNGCGSVAIESAQIHVESGGAVARQLFDAPSLYTAALFFSPYTYRPYVSETGTVFESLQIGETCTNLRPPPWTALGRAPRLRWGIIMPLNLSKFSASSLAIIIPFLTA